MAGDRPVDGDFLHVAASHGVVPAFHYYASPSLVKLTARLAALYTTVQIPVDVLIKGCSKEEEGDLRVELAMLILWSRNS